MSYLQIMRKGGKLLHLLPKHPKPKMLPCKCFLIAMAAVLFGIMPIVGYAQNRVTRDCEPMTVTVDQPFEENFELHTGDRLPECWGYLNGADDEYPAVFCNILNECCLMFDVYNVGDEEDHDQYAILPAMDNISDLQMTFDAYGRFTNDMGENEPAPFTVGVMTDPEVPETFQPVRNLTCYGNTIGNTVYFNQYEGEGMYIAFKVATPDYYYENNSVDIDNIVVSVMPSCPIPFNLSVANNSITESSATVSWISNGDESAWEIRYSTDQTNWTSLLVTEKPYTLGDLIGNTVYYIQLRADCGDDDFSEWTNTVSFRTDCPQYHPIPFSENFDSYEPYDPYGGEPYKTRDTGTRLPNCWSSLNGLDNYDFWYVDNNLYPYIYHDMFYDYPEIESNCLQFNVYNDYFEDGEVVDQYAILPAIQNVSALQMSFKAMAMKSPLLCFPFSIGVMTDPTNADSFVEVQTFEANKGFDDYVVYFDSYSEGGEYIAIKVGTPVYLGESYILCVDDIVVSELPSCFVPLMPLVSNIGENEVTLTWETRGEESSWQVRYSTDKDTWMTADYTEANPGATITEQLTGLRHNSLYYLQVAANCGDGDYSEWSQMTVFRTTCPSDFQDVPYYEDFDSYLAFEDRVPQCWNYINTCGGTQNQYCPYISDNLEWSYCANQYLVMALTYYSYSNHAYYDVQDLYAILPRMKNIGDLKLSFSAKGEKDAPAVHANYYCTVTVGVFDDDNIFHEIADIAADRTAFTNHSVTFNGYSGDGKIAFLLRPPVSFGKEHSAVSIDNIAVEPVVHETVVPYTSNDDGWNLIASPVLGSIQPTDVENMIPGTEEDYDLFAFDQSFEGAEWRNYKVHGFALQNGQGYLYANSNPVTLSFAGAMQPAASVDVPLNYSTGNTFAGWNLIGNPFNVNATITGVSDYYRISGNMLAVSSGEIEPCEGIFVQATANGQSVTFARTDVAQGEPETKGALDFGLYAGSTNRCLDLARIRFGEGNNLGKLNLLSDPNKLYIPIDGKDYAVVHTTAIGELPLNFKAAENGRFTLAVNAEEVDLSYLHLVDNLTGMDIDLLSTPSYSFEAHFADYASRFKVVFAQGNSTDQESFGFIRDGHLLIFGEGQYTLQIIDMTGRVLSSDVISGNYDKQFNFAPGIYMLRLVNGNEVKVQKIMNK